MAKQKYKAWAQRKKLADDSDEASADFHEKLREVGAQYQKGNGEDRIPVSDSSDDEVLVEQGWDKGTVHEVRSNTGVEETGQKAELRPSPKAHRKSDQERLVRDWKKKWKARERRLVGVRLLV